MLEAVLLVVGLFATAILSWSMSHRPDWWRVPTELHGFSLFAAVMALFIAFNWFAFSYSPGSPALWFFLTFVAFGWFSFRIHEEFDSSLTGGGANAPRSSVPAAIARVGRWYSSVSVKAAVANPRVITDPQRRATGRGKHRPTDITEDFSSRLMLAKNRPYPRTDIRERHKTTRSERVAPTDVQTTPLR